MTTRGEHLSAVGLKHQGKQREIREASNGVGDVHGKREGGFYRTVDEEKGISGAVYIRVDL